MWQKTLPARSKSFALLEVVITFSLLVLMLGGVVSLLALSTKNFQTSAHRYQAMLLAERMVEKGQVAKDSFYFKQLVPPVTNPIPSGGWCNELWPSPSLYTSGEYAGYWYQDFHEYWKYDAAGNLVSGTLADHFYDVYSNRRGWPQGCSTCEGTTATRCKALVYNQRTSWLEIGSTTEKAINFVSFVKWNYPMTNP